MIPLIQVQSILQSYEIIIGLKSAVKSLLPIAVDKSRKLFAATILRLHFFYQKRVLTPLRGWTIEGACQLDTFGGNVIELLHQLINLFSEWYWSWPNVLNIRFTIAFWNLSRALKNLETYSSRRLLLVNLLTGVLRTDQKKCLFPTLFHT